MSFLLLSISTAQKYDKRGVGILSKLSERSRKSELKSELVFRFLGSLRGRLWSTARGVKSSLEDEIQQSVEASVAEDPTDLSCRMLITFCLLAMAFFSASLLLIAAFLILSGSSDDMEKDLFDDALPGLSLT